MGRPRKGDLRNRKPTRDRILDAAEELFALHGFETTSVDAIAHRAGLTVGALYRHFSAKGELLLDVVRRALTSLPIAHHMRGDNGGADLLPAMAALYTSPGSRRLRRLVVELHAAAGRNRQVVRLFREFGERMAADTRTRLEAGLSDGTLQSSRNPDLTARLLMLLIAGLAHVDTLYPALPADPGWNKLVIEAVASLLGVKQPELKTGHALQSRARAKRRERAISSHLDR
jgi:AcrR family transcriptional regulator